MRRWAPLVSVMFVLSVLLSMNAFAEDLQQLVDGPGSGALVMTELSDQLVDPSSSVEFTVDILSVAGGLNLNYYVDGEWTDGALRGSSETEAYYEYSIDFTWEAPAEDGVYEIYVEANDLYYEVYDTFYVEVGTSSSSSARPTLEELYDDGILEIAHDSALLDSCQLFLARDSYLDSDLDCTGSDFGPTFSFMLDDLTLDCRGYTIYGDGNEALYAGFFYPFLGYYPLDGITVRNCRFEGFDYGIISEDNSGLTLENVEFNGISDDAVILYASTDVLLQSLHIRESGVGINVDADSSFTLLDSDIQDNFYGLGISSAQEHIVQNSIISNNFLENVHIQNAGSGEFYSNVMCGSRIDFYCDDSSADPFLFKENFVGELQSECISNVVATSSGETEVEFFSTDLDVDDLPTMQRFLDLNPGILSTDFTLDLSSGSSYSGLFSQLSFSEIADVSVDSILTDTDSATGPLVDVTDLIIDTELDIYSQFLETQIDLGTPYADMIGVMGLSGLSIAEVTQTLVQTTGDAAFAAGVMDTYLSSGGVSDYQTDIIDGLVSAGASEEEVVSALAATGLSSTTVQEAVSDAGLVVDSSIFSGAISEGSEISTSTSSLVQTASASYMSSSVASSLLAGTSTGFSGMAVSSGTAPAFTEVAFAALDFSDVSSDFSGPSSSSSDLLSACNDNLDNNADGRYDFYGGCFTLEGEFVHGFAELTPTTGDYTRSILEEYCSEGNAFYGFPGNLQYLPGDESCFGIGDDSELYFPSMFGNNVCDESSFCFDGIDNDADGLVDCQDPDCAAKRCHADFNDYICEQSICVQIITPDAQQATAPVAKDPIEFIWSYPDLFSWLETGEVINVESGSEGVCRDICLALGQECLFAEAGRNTCELPGSSKCTCI